MLRVLRLRTEANTAAGAAAAVQPRQQEDGEQRRVYRHVLRRARPASRRAEAGVVGQARGRPGVAYVPKRSDLLHGRALRALPDVCVGLAGRVRLPRRLKSPGGGAAFRRPRAALRLSRVERVALARPRSRHDQRPPGVGRPRRRGGVGGSQPRGDSALRHRCISINEPPLDVLAVGGGVLPAGEARRGVGLEKKIRGRAVRRNTRRRGAAHCRLRLVEGREAHALAGPVGAARGQAGARPHDRGGRVHGETATTVRDSRLRGLRRDREGGSAGS